ncbi:hypothetical protein NQU36_28425, partial [Escherichia coli]|uniref:hypothetical protein n=1 Tax=Escherichia coli TaxID=562 RepID=UPI0021176962
PPLPTTPQFCNVRGPTFKYPKKKKKKNHIFLKMVKNYFRGPFQNGANSACQGSLYVIAEKIKNINKVFGENV